MTLQLGENIQTQTTNMIYVGFEDIAGESGVWIHTTSNFGCFSPGVGDRVGGVDGAGVGEGDGSEKEKHIGISP